MSKIPYIPDKSLYAAVMFACKMIRENGYFNKDCNIAADYYDVDVDDVKYYVRIAQGKGQKKANKKNPRKYHWYLILFVPDYIANDDCGTRNTWDYTFDDWVENLHYRIVRATKEWNARRQVDPNPVYSEMVGFGYETNIILKVFEFDKKAEAQSYLDNMESEDFKSVVNEFLEARK